jgi:sulfide:quinone oxidoreductase
MRDRPPLDVLIAGGGCAALEAMFGLQRLAGGSIQVSVLAPDEHFTDHAADVLVPFVAARAPREALAKLTRDAGARLRRGQVAAVDVDAHHVLTDSGELIAYDALLIAVGARQRQPAAHTLCFGSEGSRERMHGLVQDLETGYVRRIAFVVPAAAAWPVVLYELALMAAERAYALCQHGELTLLTAEPAPLASFGPRASRALTADLQAAGIGIRTAVRADVPARGLVELHPGGEQFTVDRIVTVPVLDGPALDGLPHDAHGFLAVDQHGRVLGAPDVYAAGDATNHPFKHASPACAQADAAAETIAAHAGVRIDPAPYRRLLEDVLLTERAALFMRRDLDADGDVGAVGRCDGRRWRATKTAGRELAVHLGISSRAALASIGNPTSTCHAGKIAERINAQPSRGPWSA